MPEGAKLYANLEDSKKLAAKSGACTEPASKRVENISFAIMDQLMPEGAKLCANLEDRKKLAAKSDVYTVKMDMCCFGMVSRDAQGEGLVRKTTQLLTNVTEVSDAMRRRCEGGHRHVHLISG